MDENNQGKTELQESLDSIKKYKTGKESQKLVGGGDEHQGSEKSVFIRSKLLSFSSNFIAGILVLSFAGYKLDEYFEQEDHLYLLIGILLGIVWSMYETYKLVKIVNRK